MKKVVCGKCGRKFAIWDIHEKKTECPYCSAVGDNPCYAELEENKTNFILVD